MMAHKDEIVPSAPPRVVVGDGHDEYQHYQQQQQQQQQHRHYQHHATTADRRPLLGDGGGGGDFVYGDAFDGGDDIGGTFYRNLLFDNDESDYTSVRSGSNSSSAPPPPQCRDKIWAVLFLVQLVALIAFGVYMVIYTAHHTDAWQKIQRAYHEYRVAAAKETAAEDSHHGDGHLVASSSSSSSSTSSVGHTFLMMMSLFAIQSALFVVGWLALLKRFGGGLIWATLLLPTVAWLLLAADMVYIGAPFVVAAVFLSCAGAHCVWIYVVRRRVPFATAMLDIVVDAVRVYPTVFVASFLGVVMQLVWLLVWAVTALCVHQMMTTASSTAWLACTRKHGAESHRCADLHVHNDDDDQFTPTQSVAWSLLLLSFYWTAATIKNVVHVTVSGVIATWYFAPSPAPRSPTTQSFKRATTTSLGSIALGSLFIAIVQLVRSYVDRARESENRFLRSCARCLLEMLQEVLEYFNVYAFTQVAIYGKTYMEAAKSTWRMIKTRGLDAVINDSLIARVLNFGALAGAILVAVSGLSLVRLLYPAYWAAHLRHMWGVYFGLGFLLAYFVLLIVTVLIESAVSTVFVCFAEQPGVLQQRHPRHYAALEHNIRTHFPTASHLFASI